MVFVDGPVVLARKELKRTIHLSLDTTHQQKHRAEKLSKSFCWRSLLDSFGIGLVAPVLGALEGWDTKRTYCLTSTHQKVGLLGSEPPTNTPGGSYSLMFLAGVLGFDSDNVVWPHTRRRHATVGFP